MVDARSDLFSLGVALYYESLVGIRPFSFNDETGRSYEYVPLANGSSALIEIQKEMGRDSRALGGARRIREAFKALSVAVDAELPGA